MEIGYCLSCGSKEVRVIRESDIKRPNGEPMKIFVCDECGLEWEE